MNAEKMERLLGELVKLQRVQVHPVARRLLSDELFVGDEPRTDRVKAYAALDGSSQQEVAVEAEVTQSTVSRWVGQWRRKGLVDEHGVAVFNVYDFFPELEE